MITYIVNSVLKGKDYNEHATRNMYAKVCSVIGIILNSILVLVKMIAGSISGSAAILADGMNNLSDIIVSVATFFGYCIAGIGAGKHHPFGHGRYEWLMALVSNLVVIMVGETLAQKSFRLIAHPEEIQFSLLVCIILIFSIAVKLIMFLYNQKGAKLIDSASLMGTAMDSLSDMASTTLILVSMIFQYLSNKNIDGWCGLAVSIFIMFSGIKSLSETIGKILGEPPKQETLELISEMALIYPEVESIGKLILHDYGLGHIDVSMNIEGSEDNGAKLQEVAGELSYQLYRQMGYESAIQPVFRVRDRSLEEYFTECANEVVERYEEEARVEKIRIITVGTNRDIYIVINCSRGLHKREKEILEELQKKFSEISIKYRVVLKLVITSIRQHD